MVVAVQSHRASKPWAAATHVLILIKGILNSSIEGRFHEWSEEQGKWQILNNERAGH